MHVKRIRRPRAGAFLALAAVLALAGCDGSDRRADGHYRFETELRPVGASSVTGRVVIDVDEHRFGVQVVASGLEPGTRISQHLNTWWDCERIGRVLVNLDTLLTVPGEGPPRGDDYPLVDEDGTLSYTATRPVTELADALHSFRGMSFSDIDLENRTVYLRDDGHRPIACGVLRESD
jgi:hypothetical protein